MGVSSSKIEEDKALQLCRERKRLVKQALDGRCSLAAAHVTYIQSLKKTGTALWKFVEPEAAMDSSLYTSTSTTEPLVLTEKSLSQFSYSSPSLSQRMDATETLSPTPSPPYSERFQANYMKTGVSASTIVDERALFPVTGTLRSSSSTPNNITPQSAERPETSPVRGSPLPSGTSRWDYFFTSPSIDNQFSFQDGKGSNHELDNVDDIKRLREVEGIHDLEQEEVKSAFTGRSDSEESEDEFDDPSMENLVQSFENRNRVLDSYSNDASPTIPSARSVATETELINGYKSNSLDLTPLKATASVVALPIDDKKTTEQISGFEHKRALKDFLSSIKEIEGLFLKASEAGKEVPRMLEANKLHFSPIFPQKEGGPMTSMFVKACFSCSEDPTHVPEEPAPIATEYLTWHRTESSRSSSSRDPLGSTLKDNIGDVSNLFENFCMNSGSHASTLDRLYAWERKLYDEVKASGMVRRDYDMKCKLLRQQESRGESSYKIDKTRAVVKDLHSRIIVAIHRIGSISKQIEELRDKELRPQLEELIEGLHRMWEKMFAYHKLQFNIIMMVDDNGSTKLSIHSESHQLATIHLEYELNSLSSSFRKWYNVQKSYVQTINDWLRKWVSLQQKSSSRKRRGSQESDTAWIKRGPPIYVTCDVWLKELHELHMNGVEDSIKVLVAETTRLLPRQEKNQGKNLNQSFSSAWKAVSGSEAAANTLEDEAPQDWNPGFSHFQSSLKHVLEQLKCFAEDSVKMYVKVEKAIQEVKSPNPHSTMKHH